MLVVRIVFISVSCGGKGYYRVVSVRQLSFDSRSFCWRSRRMQRGRAPFGQQQELRPLECPTRQKSTILQRQRGLHRGTVVEWFRALDLKSGGPGSNLPPYCYLDLFLVVPRSTASHQLGFLIVYVLFEIFSFLLIGSPISTTALTTCDTEMKLLLSSSSSSSLLLLLFTDFLSLCACSETSLANLSS